MKGVAVLQVNFYMDYHLIICMFPTVITNYCNAAPNATVSNSVIVGTYSTELTNTSTVGCAIGFAASGNSFIATCTSYNVSNGIWLGLNLACTCMLRVTCTEYQHDELMT